MQLWYIRSLTLRLETSERIQNRTDTDIDTEIYTDMHKYASKTVSDLSVS